MERTEEMVSLFAMHGYTAWQERETHQRSLVCPELHALERSAAAHISSNSKLLGRMGKLIQRKEFSNDPAAELGEISESFQRRLQGITRDLEAFEGRAAQEKQQRRHRAGAGALSEEQHWAHVLAGLQRQVSAHIASFQNYLRQHGQHVQQRESRVTKFGQGSDQVRRGQGSFPPPPPPPPSSTSTSSSSSPQQQPPASSGGYALFAPPRPPAAGSGLGMGLPRPGRNQGVIRRRNNAGGPRASSSSGADTAGPEEEQQTGEEQGAGEVNNSKSAADKGRKKYFAAAYPALQQHGGDQQQQQQQRDRRQDRHRSEQAKVVEESIGKMGKLFSQMSSLVLAQAETVRRIEDDVEAGLEDTGAAHADLVYVHEITKGNRGLILKIFGLLAFFIMLFMVWT